MRGFVLEDFERPATLRDVPDPEPGRDDVRIRVHAAGVNPLDASIARGLLHNRVREVVRGRLPFVLGMDMSGVVDAVGPGVETVAAGDEVYGLPGKPFFGSGAFAELAVASASSVAPKPVSLDHRRAAALPMAAMTAQTAMDLVQPRPGETVLVVRAAGGVGSVVVQMAAARGARVIAVARSVNAPYLRDLGAAEVIDYERVDPVEAVARLAGRVDVLVDLLGGRASLERLLGVVRDEGRAACVSRPPEDGLAARGVRAEMIMAETSRERLAAVARLVDAGALRLPAIRSYPLERAGEALAECERRHVRGKLVVTIR